MMEADDIRSAITERINRAKSLKLRECLWTLYATHLKYFQDQLHKDPELIAIEIKDTLTFSGGVIGFRVNQTSYELRYKENRTERDRFGGDQTETTHATIDFHSNGQCIFSFELRKSVTYAPDMPLFDTTMGMIDSFIEGPWVEEIPPLVDRLAKHKKSVWDRRNAPQLLAQMKKFGLR
jgi:hypothetical protein